MIKVLALLYSIGEDGHDVLDSVGCYNMDASATYDSMTNLRNNFGIEQTVYVKTQICYS